jgi:hypothetical protein
MQGGVRRYILVHTYLHIGLYKLTITQHDFGSEVLTAVTINSYIFWDITPCSPVKVNRRFGRKYHLHLQGLRVSQERN